MAGPDPPNRRSAFFFLGRLDPQELANFNVQNVLVRDRGAVVEVIGHAIAIWWPSRPRKESSDLSDAARAWFLTIASSYYLETGTALEVRLVSWVEALDVNVRETMIGIADSRFAKVPVVAEADPINRPMRNAISLARRLRRRGGDLELATHELFAAANTTTPQGHLRAFRAVECVRRYYQPTY